MRQTLSAHLSQVFNDLPIYFWIFLTKSSLWNFTLSPRSSSEHCNSPVTAKMLIYFHLNCHPHGFEDYHIAFSMEEQYSTAKNYNLPKTIGTHLLCPLLFWFSILPICYFRILWMLIVAISRSDAFCTFYLVLDGYRNIHSEFKYKNINKIWFLLRW